MEAIQVPGIRQDFVEANGIRLHYATAGSGPLLILLHGFPEFWYAWRKQILPLSAHFRVVAPDLRGYHLSDKPAGTGAYRIETLAQDIVALAQALGEETFYLAGHDWGGAISWQLTYHHAHHLKKVAFLNMPHPELLMRNLRRNPRQTLRSWYFFVFQMPWLPEAAMKLRLRSLVHNTFRGWSINKEAFSDEDLRIYQEMLASPGTLRAAINYYRASFRYKSPATDFRKKIQVPGMMIWGENDKALGKVLSEGTEKYFEQPFPIHYLPRCSHWVMSEYPDRVTELLVSFFTS